MAFRRSVFSKLFLGTFLLAIGSLLILDFYLVRQTSRNELQKTEERLASGGRILAGELSGGLPGEPQQWAEEAASRSEARITLIDAKGVVLADSEYDPRTMENHGGRTEVQQALQGRTGTAVRRSKTLGRELCYVAVPVNLPSGAIYALRLAVPLEAVDAAVAQVHRRILEASLAAALVAVGFAYFFSRAFTRRVNALRTFAESIASARFTERPLPDGGDELGALANSLNRMAVRLRDLVENLGLESARREAILASMVEGVLAVDQQLRVTFCNQSFLRLVGADNFTPERSSLFDLVRDPGLRDMLIHVLKSGESARARLQLPGAEGRTFEVQAAPLAAPFGRGAIAILHDISELERLERVRKDFVANVSHELRTPLTAIRGYAETLLDGALEDNENNRRFVETIKAHAIRLNNIASDLLALAELESSKTSGELEPVSLRAALQAAVKTVESEAHLRQVKVVLERLEEAQVLGNRIHLEQALVNLLDNAVKFNRPAGEVHIEAGPAGNGQVRIVIADTGIGIASEHLPRIFERFYRVDKARSREAGGTGLGLSIVKHVVERMNGTVTVESELGKGSKFTVLLPACQ